MVFFQVSRLLLVLWCRSRLLTRQRWTAVVTLAPTVASLITAAAAVVNVVVDHDDGLLLLMVRWAYPPGGTSLGCARFANLLHSCKALSIGVFLETHLSTYPRVFSSACRPCG